MAIDVSISNVSKAKAISWPRAKKAGINIEDILALSNLGSQDMKFRHALWRS